MFKKTQKVTIEIPVIPGYKFKRYGIPVNGDFVYRHSDGAIEVAEAYSSYIVNRLIYEKDYSHLVHTFNKILPMEDLPKFKGICRNVIVIYPDGTIVVNNLQNLLNSCNSGRRGFIPFEINTEVLKNVR